LSAREYGLRIRCRETVVRIACTRREFPHWPSESSRISRVIREPDEEEEVMRSPGVRSVVVVAVSCLLVGLALGFSPTAHAAWVNSNASQFQVGGKLAEIVPTLVSTAPGIANTPPLVSPTCGNQGGTSLALVRGSKLSGVDPVLYPVVVVVSCLDNGGAATIRSRFNFINPS